MKFDWKNALVTVGVAYFGILLINKFVLPLLPDGIKKLVT